LPPAIFIVGEVVKLRDSLQWFDNLSQRPLFGKRILVTRARSQASKLTAKLENLGAEVIEAPAIEITDPSDLYEALDKAIDHVQDYHWMIFTSANGVEYFFNRLYQAGKDVRALGYAKIAAIGSATAEKLKQYGIVADVIPQEYRAEGVIEAMKGKLPPHAKILLPRAEEAREILPEKLREMGAEVEVAPAYRTVCGDVDSEALVSELINGEIDVVTFTSSSTVKNLVNIIGSVDFLKDVKTACIGPVTADTAKSLGIEPDIIAKKYTIDGLVEAICK